MDLAQRIAKLSPDQRRQFELKLIQQGIDILQIPITKDDRTSERNFPLSFGQERLWFIQQLEPGNIAYNLVRATRLSGRLDKEALQKSIAEIIRRHEILRTIFIFAADKPAQVVLAGLSLPLETIDLRGLPTDKQDIEINRAIYDESRYSFDLTKGPLLRTKLLALSEVEYMFLLVIHHIVSDGTSIQVFIRELVQLYQAFCRGQDSPLPPLTIQYVDYVYWQRRWFGEGAEDIGLRKKQGTFWADEFRGEIPVLHLPYDFPRPMIQDFSGDTALFNLGIEASRNLKQSALKEKTTLYVVLLAIYNIFLARLSGMEDIIVGTPVAGRRHPDVQNLIGMFVNTLALRNYPHSEKTFASYLLEVREHTMNAFENQEYRYEDIIRMVKIERDTGRNPLFDVLFLVKNVDYARVDIPGLHLETLDYERKTAMFDLTLSAWEAEDRLHFSFEYCTKLFNGSTIARFIDYFKQIAYAVLEDFDIKIRDIDILTAAEMQKILYEFNDTRAVYPHDETVIRLFEEQVEKNPDHTAVICGANDSTGLASFGASIGNGAARGKELVLTYRQFNESCERIARLLNSKGSETGMIIGIMANRSVEMMSGIFGIMKAGAAYLPIAPDYPQERIEFMLADSNARILLITYSLEKEIQELRSPEVEKVYIEKYRGEPPYQSAAAAHRAAPAGRHPGKQDAASLAYIIYTSGSTGRPKGVAIAHRSVVNFIQGMTEKIDFSPGKTVLAVTTISFDIFALEIILPLACGLKSVLADEVEQKAPADLGRLIIRTQVDMLQFTPSRLNLLLSIGEAPAYLRSVGVLMVGGEALPDRLLQVLKEKYKGRIYNMYGPTETTVWSAVKDLTSAETVNIGSPIANTQIYIVDKAGRLQPLGIPGELCIGGDGLARGYLNRPELTAEKFISNNNMSYKANRSNMAHFFKRVYKTGDLARWLADGNIEFLGRIDHQVKIRGFRIELQEIESCLLKYEDIKEAVVTARENEKGEKYLCAYYVPHNAGETIPVSNLREYLSRELTDYMVPSYFIMLDSLPLTPAKKIDRKALPEPDSSRPQIGTAFLAPQTDLEKKITEHWKAVLKLDQVGIHDNFFALGGNSMNVIQLNTRLKESLNIDIPVVVMFQHLTIDSFAHCIMEKVHKESSTGPGSRQEKKLEHARELFKDTVTKTMKGKYERNKKN